MCLAVPMKITARDGPEATVEQGGLTTRVRLDLLEEAQVGDYVLVHAGFAIERLRPQEAEETLELWRELDALRG